MSTEFAIIPQKLKLKCGCTIWTDGLPVNDPDPEIRKSAKAKLIVSIELHMERNHPVVCVDPTNCSGEIPGSKIMTPEDFLAQPDVEKPQTNVGSCGGEILGSQVMTPAEFLKLPDVDKPPAA